jgi:hypothetical protein
LVMSCTFSIFYAILFPILMSTFWLQVHIPCFNFLTAKFILYGLDLKNRVVSIYDPAPIDPGFKQHPLRKYTPKIQRLSSVLNMVMNVACTGWNENVYLLDHVIPNGVQVNTNR